MPPASPGAVVDAMPVDLDVEGDWDLSDIPLSGVIDIRSSLEGDFSCIQERFDECSINCPSNTGDVFILALRGLRILDQQRQLLSALTGCVPMGINRPLAYSRFSVKLHTFCLTRFSPW